MKDNSLSPESTVSSPAKLVVEALPTLTVTASNSIIDVGQSETFTATANGGTGNFLFSISDASCSLSSTSSSQASNTYSYTAAPTCIGAQDVNANVIDKYGNTANALTTFHSYQTPTATGLTPSNSILDYGQYTAYSVSLADGVGPFTANLVDSNGNVIESLTGQSQGTVTFPSFVPPQGTDTYHVVATDLGTSTPFTFDSAGSTITVHQDPTAQLTPASNTIDLSQSLTYTITITNGAGPFSTALAENVTPGNVTGTATVSAPGGSTTETWLPGSASRYGVTAYAVDHGTTTPFAFNSVPATLDVRQTPYASVFSPYNVTLDLGQIVSYSLLISKGIGLFNATLFSNGQRVGLPTYLSSGVANTISYRPSLVPPGNELTLYAQVGDTGSYSSAATPSQYTFVSTQNMPQNTVLIYPTPALAGLTPTNTVLDYSQAVVYTVDSNGGIGPFTYSLYENGNLVSTVPEPQWFTGVVAFPANIPYINQADTYNVVATDLGTTTHYVFTSTSNTIEQNPAPTVTLAPSNTLLDYPQSETYSVSITNGEGPYSVALYNGTGAQIGSTMTIGSEDAGSASGQFTFTPPVGTGSGYADSYYVTVTDLGTTTNFVFSSATSTIHDYPTPYANITQASNTTLDYPQLETYTVAATNGIGPFTAELVNATGRAAGTSNIIVPYDGSNKITFTPAIGAGSPPNALDQYHFILTDLGTNAAPFTFTSNTNTIIDNPTPAVTELVTSNEVLDQGQYDTISAQSNSGTGPFTVKFVNSTDGNVLYTAYNVPLDSPVSYTFSTNNLVSNALGPTFKVIGVNVTFTDMGTTAPYIFNSTNTAAGTTVNHSLSVSAPAGYPDYICAGGSGNDNVIVSWTPDVNDNSSFSNNGPYSSVGRQASGTCAISTPTPDLSEAALGINSTSFTLYTSNTPAQGANNQTLTYTVASTGSDTLIVAACGWYECTSISPPQGCATKLILSGPDAFETAYVAECSDQSAGAYTVRANLSDTGAASIAAYVFPNGVRVSNVTGTNITFAVYTVPYTSVSTYFLNGTKTSAFMYGLGGFTANAVVTPGAGPFSFAWLLNGANAYNVTLNGSSSSNTITGAANVPAAGNYVYNVTATDLGTTTPYVVKTATATVSVTKNDTLTAKMPVPKTVSTTAIVTYNFTGTPTLFNQSKWELYVDGTLYGTTNSFISWSEQNNDGLHKFVFMNPGNNNYTAYSANTTLNVLPPSGGHPSSGGGGGGGGAPGGAGGTFKPSVTFNPASVAGTVCYTVKNLTAPDYAVVNVTNESFRIRANYISPTDAGVTVNGSAAINGSAAYTLYLNRSVSILQTAQYNYTVELTNISYIPAVHTITLQVCSVAKQPQPPNVPVNATNSTNRTVNSTQTITTTVPATTIAATTAANASNNTSGGSGSTRQPNGVSAVYYYVAGAVIAILVIIGVLYRRMSKGRKTGRSRS